MIDGPCHLRISREVATHICPRTKSALTRPGQDNTAHARVLQPVPHRGQLRHHLPRHRIAAGLIINGHDHNVRTVFLHLDLHMVRPSWFTQPLPQVGSS